MTRFMRALDNALLQPPVRDSIVTVTLDDLEQHDADPLRAEPRLASFSAPVEMIAYPSACVPSSCGKPCKLSLTSSTFAYAPDRSSLAAYERQTSRSKPRKK